MECLGPECVALLLDFLKSRAAATAGGEGVAGAGDDANGARGASRQGLLWAAAPYQDDAPAIRSAAELAGAMEHLEFAVFRRYQNQLTRAERTRLDNTIDNATFKVDRYLPRLDGTERAQAGRALEAIRESVRRGRDEVERLRQQARRADLKLKQLATLTPEGFEEFVAELFEALGYEVEQVGGTGDEGADLRVRRRELRAIVQCKYHSRGVVGSPDLQKFLGTIHHTGSHKGFFVTTRTFSLAAEKFVAEHPIELIDGPRLVELVAEALGPGARREPEPVWF
jgi:restriction system protein